MNNPYQALQAAGRPELSELGWQKLKSSKHGDLVGWLQAIENLPAGELFVDIDRNVPKLGAPGVDPEYVRECLFKLHPWRKGPLELAGIPIDTEWRSDWKWDRISPYLDLEGMQVLDIGCGNGYFGLRMLAEGADLVVGVDPTMVFVMQWLAMQKLSPGLKNFVLPLGIEDLPVNTRGFDCVFSMGVLYHRRDPVAHLQRLKALTLDGGKILLETLVLDGETDEPLVPEGRYARMRNVHAIPSLSVLLGWLNEAGLPNHEVLDVSKTTLEEQRTTDWMTFESLRESLDKDDLSLTIEGHPAPVRAAVLADLSHI